MLSTIYLVSSSPGEEGVQRKTFAEAKAPPRKVGGRVLRTLDSHIPNQGIRVDVALFAHEHERHIFLIRRLTMMRHASPLPSPPRLAYVSHPILSPSLYATNIDATLRHHNVTPPEEPVLCHGLICSCPSFSSCPSISLLILLSARHNSAPIDTRRIHLMAALILRPKMS